MKINLIGEPRIIMQSKDGRHNYFGWPSLARLKNGKLIAAASGSRVAHVCPFGKAVVSYGDENGESFTAPAPIIDTPLDDRDAGLCPFGESGLILTSFNNTVAFQRTTNAKLPDSPRKAYIEAYLNTVTPEEEAKYLGTTFKISRDNGVSFGELYKSPITSPHGPIELKDGSILWVGCGGNGIHAYSVNTENGEMTKVGTVDTECITSLGRIPCEPYAIELKDGTILCHIRADKYKDGDRAFTLYQTESHDGGKSWSIPYQLLGNTGGAPAHLLEHSSGAIISVYGYRTSPFGIKVMFSSDGGKSWDKDNYLFDSANNSDLGYPASVELSDGSILTIFYAKLESEGPSVIYAQRWSFEG